jgi:predicted NUDIX family NTP pyrophosphohydrolase
MMRGPSAGVVLYRCRDGVLEFLLVHPGGPYWSRKDDGAWSIPKGEFAEGELPEAAARREFEEETGTGLAASLMPLTPVRQRSGKVIHAFAAEGDLDADAIRSNVFSLEWPPRSGAFRDFPEADRAGWFDAPAAARKLIAGQRPILDELVGRLSLRAAQCRESG